MLKQGLVASFVLVSLTSLAAAGCGSDDEDGGGLNNGGSNSGATAGTGAVINTTGGSSNPGSGGTGAGNGGVYDGGRTEIDDGTYTSLVDGACAAQQTELEAIPGVLELVIDVSSSMNQSAPGSRNQTKWDATRDALLDAVDALPASVAVGMLFYPNTDIGNVTAEPKDVDACVNTDAMVPIELLGAQGAAHRTAISDGIANVQLQQSTPTHDAFTFALDQGMVASRVPGDRFMLLITDGAPTLEKGCLNEQNQLREVDAEPIVREVQRAADMNIRTFLIGSPGSESNRDWMSRAAVIGGTALDGCQEQGPNYCHMDMTTAPDFSQALVDGLAAIAGIVSPCAFEIPGNTSGGTIDPSTTNVLVTQGSTHTSIGRDDVGDCTDGFTIANNVVTLCPDTCSWVQADPTNRVEVMFGCDTLPPPVK